MNKAIIKSIAVICALIGIYYLLAGFKGHVWFVSEIFRGNYPLKDEGLWIGLSAILILMILLVRPIAGLGLYKLKNWGKFLTIAVLSADFLVRVAGFINTWTYSIRNPEYEKTSMQILNSLSEAQVAGQQIHFQTVSMIPSYMIAVVSLVSIILLFRFNASEFTK